MYWNVRSLRLEDADEPAERGMSCCALSRRRNENGDLMDETPAMLDNVKQSHDPSTLTGTWELGVHHHHHKRAS